MIQNTIKHVFQTDNIWWEYYNEDKENIRPAVVDNVVKMLSCGSSVRGYACYTCPNKSCGHIKYVPFTCKSRFCSSCGKKLAAQWIQRQIEVLPKTEWQHITFTMPKTLWRLFQLNQFLLNSLSSLAAKAVQKFAENKNITIGIFTALHTFGRDLKWNTHIHLSVTRGGITEDNAEWKNIYFPKKPVMKQWRYEVINLLRSAYQQGELLLPDSLKDLCKTSQYFNRWLNRQYQRSWIIHFAKPSKAHWMNINYLGRYLKRPPLAQSRLRHYDGKAVVFRYLNHKTKKHDNFHCNATRFIQRFTQHIPEKGFRLIRYYGFLANRVRGSMLNIVYNLIGQTIPKISKPIRWSYLLKHEIGFDPLECILCGKKLQLAILATGKSSQELHHYHKELATMKPIIA